MQPSEIRKILADLEISQAKASELIGISPRTMRAYLSGQNPIPAFVEQPLRVLLAIGVDQWNEAMQYTIARYYRGAR